MERDFQDWVTWVFDHPVTKPEWFWADDAQEERNEWNSSPAQLISYATALFEEPFPVLEPYSEEQLNEGLWFIASQSCSGHMETLLHESVSLAARQRCIRAMPDLFRKFFAGRCSSKLSHIDEPGVKPLNSACFMWWDHLWYSLFLEPVEERRPMDPEFLSAMRQILSLSNDACRESALHGLGHWQRCCPAEVEQIIDQFLSDYADCREELRAYAKMARSGDVQ